MAVSNGDILRFGFRFTDLWDNDMMLVHHVQVTTRGTDELVAWLTQAAKYTIASWTGFFAYIASGIVLKDVRIDKVEWSGGKETVVEAFGIIDLDGYLGGSGVGDPLPPGTAPLVKWRTTGIKCLPRKFLFPVVESAHSEGGLSGAALTALATCADIFLDPIVLGGGITGTIQAVTHSKRAGAWLPFISSVAEKYMSYQRRRRQGVGS